MRGDQNDSAIRWTTPLSTCSLPLTPRKLAVFTRVRYASYTLRHTTTFTNPVSSSIVRNTTPDAVPGRWRYVDSGSSTFSGDYALVPVQTVRAGTLYSPEWGPYPGGWLPEVA